MIQKDVSQIILSAAIYVAGFALAFIFAKISENSKKTNNYKLHRLFKFLCPLPLAIISAIRYDVGYDYLYRYAPDFIVIRDGGSVGNLEIGFSLITKICTWVNQDYQILFIATSIIINYFIIFAIFNNTSKPSLGVIIYVVGGYYFQSMGFLRQYLAVAICISNYKYLSVGRGEDKNAVLKWSITVIIASLFHSATLILLVLPFLKHRRISDIGMVACLILTLFFTIFIFKDLVGLLSGIGITNISKYAYYATKDGDVPWVMIFVSTILLLYCRRFSIICQNIASHRGNVNLFVNMFYLAILFGIMGAIVEPMWRLAEMLNLFAVIIIPNIYEDSLFLVNKGQSKIRLKKTSERRVNELLIVTAMFFVMSVGTVYHTLIGSYKNLPYQTFLQRPINIEQDINQEEIYRNLNSSQ